MLGRYVAGTLLILGAAMVMAPDSPPAKVTDVARASASPGTDAVVPGADATPAAASVTTRQNSSIVLSAEPESDALKGGIEEAVVAAMELDSTEDAAEPAEQDAGPEADTPLVADAEAADGGADTTALAALSTDDSVGVWKGLSDPNGASDMVARPERQPEPAVDPVKEMFVTGSLVNVREGPSTDFGVVGTVVRGQSVEFLASGSGNWVEIRINDGGQSGFMSKNFLSETQSDG